MTKRHRGHGEEDWRVRWNFLEEKQKQRRMGGKKESTHTFLHNDAIFSDCVLYSYENVGVPGWKCRLAPPPLRKSTLLMLGHT